ncbi:MAG: hypothetical protein RMJ98_08595 [Myxococcales bacterium]|nr:hypothetical protein [Polyangiaceae bacterium]MDW8249346.1 hypothetical protein [Myxococcales bacterium]
MKAVGPLMMLVLVSCSVGEGQGEVTSDRLLAKGCFDGPYRLKPTFFATSPYRQTQTIRLQRTDELIDNVDGVQILVSDTAQVRGKLGQPLKVGLPPGVQPPGVPIPQNPDPPFIQLSLYLHETCHGQNITLHALQGTITFQHIFSGDRIEEDADDRLSEASFEVEVADPRDQPPQGGEVPSEKRSKLKGWFRFFFERGQPAQPFP